ncbi:MAG: hypothetical protein JNL98_40205 [Bryobacterales bacterium]|nr:hypothetical protein [Bryobacterales bacterium]
MKPQGLLVHGSNHFIVNGSAPSMEVARALVRRWEFPSIGFTVPKEDPLAQWSICTKAFREDLQWAVVLSGDTAHTVAVTQLLAELSARGVTAIHGDGPMRVGLTSSPTQL